jgi:hypothetical protein
MALITLFDKSFLQSLSVDESVWFDHFFHALVCPLFYVETLADLDKPARDGKTPEDEVRIIASKFPEAHGDPSAFHLDLCISSLRQYNVPVRRGIPTFSGRAVEHGGSVGMVMGVSPEGEAFNRWMAKEFNQIEHQYAKSWRNQLANVNLKETAKQLQSLGVNPKSCKTFEDAKSIAENIVHGRDKVFERMKLACLMLRVPAKLHTEILRRWTGVGSPAISSYAPYAAYVLTVEVFFQVALAANLISTDRPSNLLDIAYLSYLPFCDIFVSNDHLHIKCASLFMNKDQKFICGSDLKKELKAIDEFFDKLSDEEKDKGVLSFAKSPPKDGRFLVSELWDKYCVGWRTRKEIENPENRLTPEQVEELIAFHEAPTVSKDRVDFDSQNFHRLSIHRKVHKKKGKWFQVPKDLENK